MRVRLFRDPLAARMTTCNCPEFLQYLETPLAFNKDLSNRYYVLVDQNTWLAS